MFKKLFISPIVRMILVFVLITLLSFIFPATRALANDFLGLFRVQRVVVLPIDSFGMEKTIGTETFGSALSKLISNSTLVIDEAEEPVFVADIEQANKIANFEARLPKDFIPSEITVFDSTSFVITIDRFKAQSLLDSAGRNDIQLPDEIDGAEILVNIPSAIRVNLGNCNEVDVISINCILFSQMPSPTADVPDDLNMSELIKISLELSGMDNQKADEFVSNLDWTTTLIIPIPTYSTIEQDIIVDGVSGKLIQKTGQTEAEARYILLWVKDGVIYAISGSGTDAMFALVIADTLP